MPVARTRGAVVVGVEGVIVEVEADVAAGLVGMTIVGLPDKAVGESRDRARTAVVNSGLEWPQRKITIALLPTDLHKRGSGLDLSVAVAVLAATEQIPATAAEACVVMGELGLDGRVRPVRGVVSAAIAAHRAGIARLVVPRGNSAEASLVPGLEVVPVDSLLHLVHVLRGITPPEAVPEVQRQGQSLHLPDLSDVRGQSEARWALEVAAAGGHHLAMIGMPGVGKTLLAERLPGILPPLDTEEALEVTSIRSAFGLLPEGAGLVDRPPFEAPHHSASEVALVGGGAGSRIRAGLVTLAHHGVLFLDEAPEFDRAALEALRQSLESGVAVVARSGFSVRLPARFQLLIAANPCPCGFGLGRGDRCTCSSLARRRYAHKLSGPLLDRIDLRVELEQSGDLIGEPAESSATVADRVRLARERAAHRWQAMPWTLNAHVPPAALRSTFPPTPSAWRLLRGAVRERTVSQRGADRVLRVAWTLADLAGTAVPGDDEVAAALAVRSTAPGWAA
ncbi:MAG: YifB family Mg chelatase-like AAA ATPase [Actinobacteria bacterium]|nr:YifB family Mg chelatase-like AAA ATPase [Actinomycetota bacterium]